jgi:two-component system nitrate/nitrite response regulator NarL
MEERITIYLVDDHQIMLDGVKSLLDGYSEFKIVGESTRSSQALMDINKLSPQVVITDIHMPEMNGVEFTSKLHAMYPEIKVVALSMSDDETMITSMLDAGVSGYIIKNTGKEELRTALLKIFNNEVYLSPEIATILTKAISRQRKMDLEPEAKLTQREIEIVKLIALEYSNEKIAEKLFISERTVETHRKNIFRKTKTKGVVGLVRWAVEHNIVKL